MKTTALKALSFVITIFILAACSTPSTLDQAEQSYKLGDYRTAFVRTASLANDGDPKAQYVLGYMYYYGLGTAKSHDTARDWFQKAAAQGEPRAETALNILTNVKPAEQLEMFSTSPTPRYTPEKHYVASKNHDVAWLREQKPSAYAIKVPKHEAAIISKTLMKLDPNLQVAKYHYLAKGKVEEAHLAGIYQSHKQALAAVKKLPHQYQKLTRIEQVNKIQEVMLP